MSNLNAQFEESAKNIHNLTVKPTNDELLNLYGLYKQGTVGDINTNRPGMFDIKGKAKWDNWNTRKGMGQNDAKLQYVAFVDSLLKKYQ